MSFFIRFSDKAHPLSASSDRLLGQEKWAEIEDDLKASLRAFEEGGVILEVAQLHKIWGLICQGI